ncbi:hypothetical protein, partial [Gilvimarinus sp. 1_MG-2023]|uniref:hypothetical protein n=1 Tax=Gilvimarinus sp. 1_MG-2023 TaxID=3062638 RepID=UPI0026E441D3
MDAQLRQREVPVLPLDSICRCRSIMPSAHAAVDVARQASGAWRQGDTKRVIVTDCIQNRFLNKYSGLFLARFCIFVYNISLKS